MKRPHERHKDFPIGRVCMICGRGATPRLGGCYGSAHALQRLGYQWDRAETLGFSHRGCLARKQERAAA